MDGGAEEEEGLEREGVFDEELGAVSVCYLVDWTIGDILTLMMSAESRCLVLLGFVSPTKSFGAMSWILPLYTS